MLVVFVFFSYCFTLINLKGVKTMMSPEEFQLWSLFNSARIGSALAFIATAIFIWLAFRIAVGTRVPASGEAPNLAGKIMSSIFCALTVMGSWIQWSEGTATYIIQAYGLDQLKERGIELSDVGQGWIEYVGTTEVTGTPTPLGIAFMVLIAIMYAAIIWVPKQD